MRKWVTTFLSIIFFLFARNSFSFSQDYLEIDLSENRIKLVNFVAGSYIINGSFIYAIERKNGSLSVSLEGEGINLMLLEEKGTEKVEQNISWVKLRLVKIKDIVFINHFSFPQFNATGIFDFKKSELNFNICASWYESSRYLEGDIKLEANFWGRFSDLLTSGSLIVDKGVYHGNEFDNLRLDFFGKPPLLNITDSELILSDGSIVEIEGNLDLRDSSNMIPSAEFTAHKIIIDGWQLFSAKSSEVGLKKDIDKKIGVSLDTGQEEEYQNSSPKTELRYNWQGDNFLKLRVNEEESILGIEKRRNF